MEFNGSQALMIILALTVGGLVWRQLMKWKRRDSESTSRTDDGSGEDNEALRRDSESTSTMDNASRKKYDVFLSFRGSDTRLSFTDCLYWSMKHVGIRVFLDSEELEDGKKISEVLKAVDESQIYIPIFSRNFATSSWCLREVARMVECTDKSNEKKQIIPIFYDVKADDVKLKTDLYKRAIRKHKRNFLSFFGLHRGKFDSYELKRWETALVDVGGRIGREIPGKRQGEQIDSIVEEVCRKLRPRGMVVTEHLVEDRTQMEAIMELLDIGSNGVRFVGLHGTGGVGKTTLAKVIFNKLFCHFEGHCFLADIRSSMQSHDGLLNLQKKLLSGFLGYMDTNQIENVDGGVNMIKKVFSDKKVLIVLDDMDEAKQLENLAGKSDWFYFGSRIIITTREISILKTQVDQVKGILTHEVLGMRPDLALDLFYKHAFRSDTAIEEYEAPSREIVHTVGMLPLAIVVVGSHLFNEGNDLGHSEQKAVWDETRKKLNEGPLNKVRKTLIISYERLESKEKEVFLDIACFFTNDDRTYPFIMWNDCGYYPVSAIRVLSDRSLVKLRDDNRFWMHDQVRDYGRYIVHEEYPRKFCRVWIREKALELLERNEKNENVEALSLMFDGHSITREKLACLPKLRFLRVEESDFSGNFENLHSELKFLSWRTSQTTFHAENFHFSKLVVLNLSGSDIEDGWGGWSQVKMNKLKVLDLTGCIRLKTTPDFSNFTSLKQLILAQCVKLTTIHSSIGKLKCLETLNIKQCSSLGELPEEIGSLQSLIEIVMPQNICPFKLPETFGKLQSLSSLILDENPGISQLPNSIGGLVKVTRLSLHRCLGIKKLPCSIGKMKMLEELDLSKSGIVELPNSIGWLKKLKVIRVNHTVIKKFPCTIGQVEILEELHAKKCWDLTDENLEELGKLSRLRILDLSYTEVSKFPTMQGCLSQLQTLEMSSNHLPKVQHLPPSLTRLHLQACHFPSTLHFASLVSLDYLELSRLTISIDETSPTWASDSPEEQMIHTLPSGLSTLKFRGISLRPPLSNLERLSVLCVIEYPMSSFSISKGLQNLKVLKLSNCKLLEKISGLLLLKNLEHLDLNKLESLVDIDDLSELESLMYFRISHCGRIERLPSVSKLDRLGHIELEACPKLRVIEGLERLELDDCGCTILKRLIDVSKSTWLSNRVTKNQVLLSFKGPEICDSSVDRLHKDLVHNRISVWDDEGLSFGDGIGKELPLDAFDIYIPFLCENYASSVWRLRELAHMVECTSKSSGRKKILPIFYHIEVDDVKLESDLYKSALAKHRRKFGNEAEEWERALIEVAGMKGFHLQTKSHKELIDLVKVEVLCKLNAKSVDVPQHLVGIDDNVEELIKLLDIDSSGVRFVGIYGMSGSGKTTLAKVLFNKLFSHFDGATFMNDVDDSLQHGLINLQKKLLLGFVGSVIADQIEDCEDGMNWIKRVCETRKVLIVLDNVWDREQLQKLVGNWFGSGSRIIITTRDSALLDDRDYSSYEEGQKQTISNILYEICAKNPYHSFLLFCKHAFKRDFLEEEYDCLARQIICSVGLLVVAIEVIGSYLHYHGSNLEPHGDKRSLWEGTLRQLEEVPHDKILHKLMISFKRLEYKQQEVFLDIACFFTNEDQTYPVIMWDDYDYNPNNAIDVLVQLSLIKISDNKFWMHDMLRDLGRYIVLKNYSCKLSRVWSLQVGPKLLESKQRNEVVEALSLTYNDEISSIGREELATLPNLRFLRVKGIDFVGDFDNLLSELRWLSWQTCEMTFRANNFHFTNLVVLELSNSDIEDGWGGWSQMKVAES
ncbi:hypothetical protein BT93_C1650 [Corymbia citriodora subsp. variegata]|nr:hypothetical protein BT93_C1650 [Corymbia citriodora subsp. variegata]